MRHSLSTALWPGLWSAAAALLLQHRCVFCQELTSPRGDLCDYCAAELPMIGHACRRCALAMPEERGERLPYCAACLSQPPPVRHTLACCHYAYPADFLIQQLKFAQQLKYARLMGALLAETVSAAQADSADLILPIPLAQRRYRQRGFNQAAEIAHYAAASLGRRICQQTLRRRREQRPQASLGRRLRKSNIKGAFSCEREISGRHCVLVDDVMTTGATVYEAATTLLRAGAASVDVWVFARTPPGG